MTRTEIDDMVSRRESLTAEEFSTLVKGICENPETREIAINGAMAMGNYDLALILTLNPSANFSKDV